MTRICTLISTLIFLAFASPSHAVIFHFSFDGVEGFLSDLPDPSGLPADVTVTASPGGGGLGVYTDPLSVFFVNNGAISIAIFFDIGPTGIFSFRNISTGIIGELLVPGGVGGTGPVTFTPVAEVPVPAALPLFATGLGALGLMAWRRKRKPQRLS